MRNHVVVCILSLSLTTCVSVQLPGGKMQPATGVSFQAPNSPFKEIQAAQIDKSWQSTKTGNTISYFSNCGTSSDPSLESLERDALNAINDLQIKSSEDLSYNSRAARRSLGSGQIDGIPVQLSVLVFKKNNCNYTLTYGGVEKNFAAELTTFDQFTQNFKAP